MIEPETSLAGQRALFKQRRFLATPIAGLIAWSIVGISSFFFSPVINVWILFIATGSIAYLGMFISKYTGEHFLDKTRPKNTFDQLFFLSIGMALLVYSIAIPFFLIDYTSLPLTVGILSGLMWMPFSWIVEHWIGIFHSVTRTLLIVAAWYLFPEWRFTVIPFLIVGIYIATIVILEKRWQHLQQETQLNSKK